MYKSVKPFMDKDRITELSIPSRKYSTVQVNFLVTVNFNIAHYSPKMGF